MKERDLLKQITAVFLEEKTDYQKLSAAVKEYKTLLIALAGLEDNDAARENIHFENGKALGTTWAAMCIDDLMRTRQFAKGLYKAVQFLKPQKEAPVHILYAGCGPFAALILPLLTRFSPKDIQCSLLEINPLSYAAVQKVIFKLGLGPYIKAIEHTDATKFRVNNAGEVDIFLSETMQHALVKEQQVPIMMNLLSQLPQKVIVIPQKIELDLVLYSQAGYIQMLNGNTTVPYYKKVSKIFELSKESIIEFNASHNKGEQAIFPEASIQLTPQMTAGYNRLAILTAIQVFDDIVLGINESALTLPLMLADIGHIHDKEITVKLQYHLGAVPGFDHSVSYS